MYNPGLLSTSTVSVQKQTEPGLLYLALLQGGPVIDKGSTTAQYGIVSLTGECNRPLDVIRDNGTFFN